MTHLNGKNDVPHWMKKVFWGQWFYLRRLIISSLMMLQTAATAAEEQCDLMATTFLNIWPFTPMKTYPMPYKVLQKLVKNFPNSKTPQKKPKTLNFLPKWAKFLQNWSHCSRGMIFLHFWFIQFLFQMSVIVPNKRQRNFTFLRKRFSFF